MSEIIQRGRREWADRALKNAITRAEKHIRHGDQEAAITALRSGCKTAASWLDRTHPQYATHIRRTLIRRRPAA